MNIDQCFRSFCGENQLKLNLPRSIKMYFLVFTLFNTLVSFRCSAKLSYSNNTFPWRHASFPWELTRKGSAVLGRAVALEVAHIL